MKTQPCKKDLNTCQTCQTLGDFMQVSVREVDEAVFREFKSAAAREGTTVGKLITLAMKQFVDHKPQKSFFQLKPIPWGKGTEKSSSEIDEVLY